MPQVVNAWSVMADTAWPSYFVLFLSFFSWLNFDLIPWFSIDCLYQFNYIQKLALIGALVLGMWLLLAAVLFWAYRARIVDMSDNQQLVRARARKSNALKRMSLFMSFLIYPGLSAFVFRFFACTDVDGVSYLQSDMTIECYAQEWNRALPYAIVLVLLVPMGLPAFLLLKLSRADRRDPDVIESYGSTYRPYVPCMLSFEVSLSVPLSSAARLHRYWKSTSIPACPTLTPALALFLGTRTLGGSGKSLIWATSCA